MDFTREPVIETVVTPREGFKLAIRNSKGAAQEEFFVDSVEVVSFGNAFFFRSRERPKPFLVPVSDYEVLEVREARMALKHSTGERTIKIGGGRDKGKSKDEEKESSKQKAEEKGKQKEEVAVKVEKEKKRERRRSRRRRNSSSSSDEANTQETESEPTADAEHPEVPAPEVQEEKGDEKKTPPSPPVILAPPTTLIADSYRKESIEEGASEAPVSTAEMSGEESMEGEGNAGFPGSETTVSAPTVIDSSVEMDTPPDEPAYEPLERVDELPPAEAPSESEESELKS